MKTRSTHFLLSICLCMAAGQLSAQSFKGKALPAEVNTEYDETQPRLSPDDKRLYFVRARHPENVGGRGGGQDIWYSDLQPDGTWGMAKNIGSPLNNALHNHVGAVTDGGRTLWLGNRYIQALSEGATGISKSTKPSGEATWPFPQDVASHPMEGNAEKNISFHYNAATNVIVAAWATAPGQPEDLFVLLPSPNGTWQAPKSLGFQINTNAMETAPFVGQDGHTLYFTSNGRGGSGSGDIFSTRRLDDTWSNWSDPVNLGPEVNTAGFDGHFIVDAQGANGYFMSGPSATALGDIYMIPLKDIPALRQPTIVSTDTLRIFTNMNTPIPFSLDAYGVPTERATLLSGKSIDGQGTILVSRNPPFFNYQPAPGFTGKEALRLTYCDPPESDNCNEIIVLAEVKGSKPIATPMLTLRAQTYQNTPVNLKAPESMMRLANLPATRAVAQPNDGTLKIDYNEGHDQLAYFPAKDFTGTDTMYLYRNCNDPQPANCRLAQIIVEVLPPAVVAKVDSPVVVTKVDTPAVVVVPKVDTPAVVVVVDPGLPKDVLISGKVLDEKTKLPIGTSLSFLTTSGKLLGEIASNPSTGEYSLRLPAAEGYTIKADKQYYFPVNDFVNTSQPDSKGEVRHDITMTPLPMQVGQTFVLKDIYFDLDKSILKPESRAELQRLYQLMNDNPGLEIEIRGHTDNWSSDEYNETLSNNRANAVVNYLKFMGVRGSRMTWKGFGEKQPIATNETDEGRALNRRVEFVVTKI